MAVPSSLADIRNKVRRITGRPNASQITDDQIDEYINTYYIFDLNEQLRLESFRYNWQFLTNANQAVYDFPKELYLTAMPPIYIGGYQSYMTQSRENFFRINPQLNFIQQVGTGLTPASAGPYAFTLTNRPIMPGFKRNPPGAYSSSDVFGQDVAASEINWNVLISTLDANGRSMSLVDDGGSNNYLTTRLGLLFDAESLTTASGAALGNVNYTTGIGTATFPRPVGPNAKINAQYIPYVASRPQSAVFYQDQIILYPVPDQAYTVSFEAYKYPTAFLATPPFVSPDPTLQPQLRELWQLLAYGAADKIFADNGDMENMAKYRPLLDEQLKLVQRRTIVQYTSERAATIYTEQSGLPQYPFGNLFGGI